MPNPLGRFVFYASAILFSLLGFFTLPGHAKELQPIPDKLVAKPVANPLGLTLNEFSLRWQLPLIGGKQTAFHVLVASDRKKLDAGVGDLWDSGWRKSAQNAEVPYRGAALPAVAVR